MQSKDLFIFMGPAGRQTHLKFKSKANNITLSGFANNRTIKPESPPAGRTGLTGL
jgi:hypothetical protein